MTAGPVDPDDPAPGRPAAAHAVAARLAEVADVASDARRRLGRLEAGVDDSVWRGPAARAFRGGLAELPGQLGRLAAAHASAAEALAGYATTLRGLQDDAGLAVRAGRLAADDLRRAEQARDAAPAAVAVTVPAAGPVTAAGPVAALAAVPASAACPAPPASEALVAEARRRLLAARQEVEAIAGRRRRAEATCVARLEEACDHGIAGERPGLLAVTLRAISDACDVLSVVLTAVVVLVVAIALFTNPLGWAALGAAGPLLSALGWVGAASIAVKAGRRLAGDPGVSWRGIALEAALAVVPARAGRFAGLFLEADGAVGALRAVPPGRLRRVAALARGPRFVRATAQRATVAFRLARGGVPPATPRGAAVAALPDVSVNVVVAARWVGENPRRAAALGVLAALPSPAAATAAAGPAARDLVVAWAPVARAVAGVR